jgi:hypothetical protein
MRIEFEKDEAIQLSVFDQKKGFVLALWIKAEQKTVLMVQGTDELLVNDPNYRIEVKRI